MKLVSLSQVNCRGYDAFGKRKKREAIDEGPLLGNEGQLREEVTVESNQILTLERRDPSRVARQRDGSADVRTEREAVKYACPLLG